MTILHKPDPLVATIAPILMAIRPICAHVLHNANQLVGHAQGKIEPLRLAWAALWVSEKLLSPTRPPFAKYLAAMEVLAKDKQDCFVSNKELVAAECVLVECMNGCLVWL